jgi:hypothetical protein
MTPTACRWNPGHSRPWYWSQPSNPLASSWYGSTQGRRCADSTILSSGVAGPKLLQCYFAFPV